MTDEEQKHVFEVSIWGCTKEEAEKVMQERIGFDEDYGFSYRIDWRDPSKLRTWRHADGTVRMDRMDAQPGDYFG